MAGSFPDVPGYRFAYDVDGTSIVLFSQSGGSIGFLSAAQTKGINSIGSNSLDLRTISGPAGAPHYLVLLFPEVRTINGYLISANTQNSSSTIAISADTTTGQNGTWTTTANPYIYINNATQLSPGYRTSIQTVSWPNIIAVRIGLSNNILNNLHLYGSIPNTSSPDRLRIVDVAGDDMAAQLDFGDIRQRNNVTKQFKVVNNSDTKTANNITITFDTNPDASPTLIGQYQLSTDNTAYANAINIGTLAPGQSSGTLYVRDTVSATAQLGPWALRITASANTWS